MSLIVEAKSSVTNRNSSICSNSSKVVVSPPVERLSSKIGSFAESEEVEIEIEAEISEQPKRGNFRGPV